MLDTRELIQQFAEAAVNAVATVEVIPNNITQLTTALTEAIKEDDQVMFSCSDDIPHTLFCEFKKNPKVIIQPSKEEFRNVRAGVTDAFCAVASTGSVCVGVADNFASPITMLTRKHIVVVDSKTIVPRPSDLFSEEYLEGKGLKRSFSFITGTSATADMGPLVRGVHGPGKLHIIILE